MWQLRVSDVVEAGWRSRAVDALRARGVVAYPTDTLYGLAADPRSAEAIRRLYRIKGRSVDQAIPLIAAGPAQLDACGLVWTRAAARLARVFWPGPLTLVVPAWPGLCADLLNGGSRVAVRVPAHDLARTLADVFGYPITSTSANRSGEPATADPAVVAAALGDDLEGLLDGGMSPGGPPSTIVDTCDEALRLVRAGAVPWERVLEFGQ